MANRFAHLFAALALTVAGMKAAAPDACTLLSPDAIRQATGQQVTNSKITAAAAGKVRQSQCFYSLASFADSISVTLTTPSGLSHDAAREMWERWFHRDEEGKDKDRDKDKLRGKPESEEEEAAAKAAPVAGLGDEAYWVHSFVGNL